MGMDEGSAVATGDAILLENIQVPAALGVTAEEREMRRPVRIDLELGRNLAPAGSSDRIEDTIDYGDVYRIVEAVAGDGEHRLVEALAERVADALLGGFDIEWVRVSVRKSRPLAGVVESAGVRVTRQRAR